MSIFYTVLKQIYSAVLWMWYQYSNLYFFVNIPKVTQAELQKFLTVCSPSPVKDSLYPNLNICTSIQMSYFKEGKRPVASMVCSGKGISNAVLFLRVKFILTFGKLKGTRKQENKGHLVNNTMSTGSPSPSGYQPQGLQGPRLFSFLVLIWDEISRSEYFYVLGFDLYFFFLICSWKTVFTCQLNSSFPPSCSSCLCTNITDCFLFQLFVQEWNPVNWQASI